MAASVLEHRFGTGPAGTVGVEEELMLLDPETWELAPGIDALLAATDAGPHAAQVKSELMQSVLEITTPACRTAGELEAELRRLRGYVAAAASGAGYRIASAGTHPFSRAEQQPITGDDRYQAMVDEFQFVAREQLIFGLHVHTAVADAETAIRVVDGACAYLPELLALSANSPFWRGRSTGLVSCRQVIFATLPRSGLPPRFDSYAEFAEVVGRLQASGCIPDYTRIWWDIRPHPRLGTVELRVCDGVTRVEDTVALAAYFQALVRALSERIESGQTLPSFHPLLTTENKWLATRHGLDAHLLDLTGGGERLPLRELVDRRLRELAPHARELGSERELEGVAKILARGNGADAQLAVWDENRDLVEVTRRLAEASAPGSAPATP